MASLLIRLAADWKSANVAWIASFAKIEAVKDITLIEIVSQSL